MRKFASCVSLIMFFSLFGCSTIRNGNDASALSLESDLEEISAAMNAKESIDNSFSSDAAKQLSARNKYINGRVAVFDIHYLKYVRSLYMEKQQFDAGSDLSVMLLNIAGTLTGGVQAKANLAASATGIGGAKIIVNKEFYYEKSVDALVATMDANRSEVFASILTGLKTSSIEDYPFSMVIRDLARYQRAGTLQGAVDFIQKTATVSQAKSDELIGEIRKAVPLSTTQISSAEAITDAIGSGSLTLAKSTAMLKALGVPDSELPNALDDKADKPGAKQMLSKKLYEATHAKTAATRDQEIGKIYAVFKSEGLVN